MEGLELDGHLGRTVAIDLCHSCQAFWFDKYESLQISPPAVLRLFTMIGQAGAIRTRSTNSAKCPRCDRKLTLVKDMQRGTRFEYWGCRDNHGRLTTFFNFLREKNFIKPLSPAQIEELRRNLKAVNCSNCGAAVDLAVGTACAHCGSPLSMLDVEQASALVEELRNPGKKQKIDDPALLPLTLQRAKRDVTDAFRSFEQGSGWYTRVEGAGLVGAALEAFVSWVSDT